MAKRNVGAEPLADVALLERVQSILINAAEGRRSIGDDAQYPTLRRDLKKRLTKTLNLFPLTHPSIPLLPTRRDWIDGPACSEFGRSSSQPFNRSTDRATIERSMHRHGRESSAA